MTRSTRRMIILSLAALVYPATAWGQFGIGAKLGVNMAKLGDLEESVESGSESDFVGGAYFTLGRRVIFQPEILYSRRSTSLTTTGGSGSVKEDFIEIPLLVGFRLIPEGPIRPRVYAGPSFSFETGCKIADGTGGFADLTGECSDLFGSTDTKSTQVAGVVGGAVELVLGGLVLTGDVRYNHGLTKVLDVGSDAKWRYVSALVGVGIAVP